MPSRCPKGKRKNKLTGLCEDVIKMIVGNVEEKEDPTFNVLAMFRTRVDSDSDFEKIKRVLDKFKEKAKEKAEGKLTLGKSQVHVENYQIVFQGTIKAGSKIVIQQWLNKLGTFAGATITKA
jgi:hypothetical protein